MTRSELSKLHEIYHAVDKDRAKDRALDLLRIMILRAEDEHTAEDAWHDRPINLEEYHGTH